jgi:negative regulator of sigma E activity
MTCSDYKELISAYVDDELCKRELMDLLDHLESCALCRGEVSTLTHQKQRIYAALSSSETLTPDRDFSARVMTELAKEMGPLQTTSGIHALTSAVVSFLGGALRAPAYAISGALVLVIAVWGIGVFTYNSEVMVPKHKQLMNVYELQAHSAAYTPEHSASIEKNGESIVYQHLAYSSAQTIGTEPCLVEYAAYTFATAE